MPAHICLFHNLPGAEVHALSFAIESLCARRNSFDLEARPARFLGRGVALAYEAPALTEVRASIAHDFAGMLTAQDREPFRAHVTIQNKVDVKIARRLFEDMSGRAPLACRIEGIDLWRYRNGPWEPVDRFAFADVSRAR